MQLFGYTSDQLGPHSSMPIIAVCEECGKYRTAIKNGCRDLCRICGHPNKINFSPLFVHEHNRFIDGTGIDRIETIKKYGYDPIQLSLRSNRLVMVKCMECGKYRVVYKHSYVDLCRSCKFKTPETIRRMSIASRRPRGPMPEAQKKNLRKANKGRKRGAPSDEVRRKISVTKTGVGFTEEHRRKISASLQGIDYVDWTGYVDDNKYCHRFNSKLKKHVRMKYDNRCVVCGMTEEECKLIYGEVLSVHHVDRNREQGCNGYEWKLIPLCKQCHGKSHFDPMKSRINYLIETGELKLIESSEV